MSDEKVKFLDKGYVRLVDSMGTDLSISNAARVSYQKETKEITDSDRRLIDFLSRENHTAPFRHAFATFEIYAPLMVARQWWKYVVGSDHTMDAWSEASRRYVTSEPEFYVVEPDEWRSAPENSKQGSGGPLHKMEHKGQVAIELTVNLNHHFKNCLRMYESALETGVCAEQARLFLPGYATYVYWRWSASLQSICHFLVQRLDPHAQYEIQEGAKAVYELIEPKFPVAVETWLEHNAN